MKARNRRSNIGMWLFILPLVPLNDTAWSQAVWNGKLYSARKCPNPNCAMCNSIEAQLREQARRASQPVVQPVAQSIPSATTQYTEVVEMQPYAVRVKHCNGRRCWYENVTQYRQVVRRVPVQRSTPVAPPVQQVVTVKAQSKVAPPNLLTCTDLVPTPYPVVEAILLGLRISPDDTFMDLGCGDGRFLTTASIHYGCRSIGIELNKDTVAIARRRIELLEVGDRALVFQGDVRNQDLSLASCVSMYLYPELMEKVVPRLAPGTRIASYLHAIPGVDTSEQTLIVDGQEHTIFFGTKS